MSDLSLWASRYQFTDELWRGSARLLVDPSLERSLSHGDPDDEALRELVTALLPTHEDRSSSEAPQVWMGMERARRAGEYAHRYAGVVFTDLAEISQLAADEDWETAMVDLGGLLEPAPRADAQRLEARLSPALAAALETLAERAEEGRAVVLSAPSRAAAGPRGLSLERFAEYVDAHFDGARLYALAPAPMVGVYELGDESDDAADSSDAQDADEDEEADEEEYEADFDTDVLPRTHAGDGARARGYDDALDDYDEQLDEAEATWSQGRGPEVRVKATVDRAVDPAAGVDDPPINLDTSLGAPEPEFFCYVAVIGGERNGAAAAEGVTYIELPGASAYGEPGAPTASTRGGESDAGQAQPASGLRAQLSQAQRQAELLALDKQGLLEELEAALERLEQLEDAERDAEHDAEHDGADGPGQAVDTRALQDGRARLDAALAQAQELRWRVRELQGRNAELLARPVQTVEAENAALRAELELLKGAAESRERAAAAKTPRGPGRLPGQPLGGASSCESPASSTWVAEIVSRVDKLLRRVERGGLPALELHANLRKLRRRLTGRR